MEKITVVMVREESISDKRGLKMATEDEIAALRDASGLPFAIAEKYGIGAMNLDYELESFVVNLGGGVFVEG